MKLPLIDYALITMVFMAFLGCVGMGLAALKNAVLPKWYERAAVDRLVHGLWFMLFVLVTYIMWDGVVMGAIKYVCAVHGW